MKRFIKNDIARVILWLTFSSIIIWGGIKFLDMGDTFTTEANIKSYLIKRLEVEDIDIIEEFDTKQSKLFYYKTDSNLWGMASFKSYPFGIYSFDSCSKGSSSFNRFTYNKYGVQYFALSGFDRRNLIKKIDLLLDDVLVESFPVPRESFLIAKRIEPVNGNKNRIRFKYINEHDKDITEYINQTSHDSYNPILVSKSLLTSYLLSFQMRCGKYSNDSDETTPIKLRGPLYSGEFDLILGNPDGDELHRINLNHYFNEISLPPNFEINWDDYNNDGNSDFPIGQYINENLLSYRIFSIIDDELVELPFEKRKFFGSFADNRYSPKLEKTADGFIVKSYSQNNGKYISTRYVWNDNKFKIKEN